jgi:hypothetical protein
MMKTQHSYKRITVTMHGLAGAACLLVSGSLSHSATVQFSQVSEPEGLVTSTTYVESGTVATSVIAANSSYYFTHWTLGGPIGTRQEDYVGRALNPFSFTILEATQAVAHYVPASQDCDGDGLEDWFEIEFFNSLTQTATSDADADGFTLLEERGRGYHPKLKDEIDEGGVSRRRSMLTAVILNSDYVQLSEVSAPLGLVSNTRVVAKNSSVNLTTAPAASSGYYFTGWLVNGARVGNSLTPQPVSITVTDTTTAVARYVLETADTDVDGILDWYEMFHFDNLTQNGTSDSDGDGFTLAEEVGRGYNPNLADGIVEGGISRRRSMLTDVNLAGYSTYRLVSTPAGLLNTVNSVPDNTVITTPNLWGQTNSGYRFAFWDLAGVRQVDALGMARGSFSFTVTADVIATAHYLSESEDSDGDGLLDWWELNFFSDLTQDGASDSDADGMSLAEEHGRGYNPTLQDSIDEGGISRRRTGNLITVNLQPFDRLSKMLVGGVLTDFFSPDPSVVMGIDAGPWSSMAATDWDGDGDFDLFVANEEGLRVFRNIGTARNPNFAEITTGFAALNAFVTAINRPSIAGGDWNDDGFGDLVIGGNTGTLRLVASGGSFSANGNGPDLAVGSTSARPALGDMNADGRDDLIVLLADGTAQFYLNNGLAMPFAGPGTSNFLGVAAPTGTSIATGDINQDGVPDVLLADADGRIWEFIKSGGAFTLKSKVWGGSYEGFAAGLTLAAADLEGDGDLDLIGGLANGGVIALRDPSVGRPTGLVATPGANSIQLDWDPNWQSRIRGYYIYRALAAVGPFAKLIPDYVPLPHYLDAPVSSGVSYFYYVSGISYFFTPGNSEPRLVESLPSDIANVAGTAAGKVILSVRPVNGKAGQRVKIKLSIENATGVSGVGMQIRVAYNATKLQPWAQAQPGDDTVLSTGLSKNLTFTDNGATATGELIINGSAGSLEPGSGKLFTLQFKVGAGVPSGSVLGVTITQATMRDLNGSALTVEILALDQPESGDTYTEGDLTGDGLVTTADKNLLKDLIKPKSRAPTANELMSGDLNADGKLDEKDLVLLLRLLNGLNN